MAAASYPCEKAACIEIYGEKFTTEDLQLHDNDDTEKGKSTPKK